MNATSLQPADVVVVRGGGLAGEMIRLGAALAGKPNLSGHVAIMHHYDSAGVPWGLEGRPGGVGWADMRPYIASHWTMNNAGQPGRTDAARQHVAENARALLGTAYDWAAIGGDGLRDLHIYLWNLKFPHEGAPGHVVCSSYAAWLYEEEGWDHPGLGEERYCQPGDWDAWTIEHGYSRPLT